MTPDYVAVRAARAPVGWLYENPDDYRKELCFWSLEAAKECQRLAVANKIQAGTITPLYRAQPTLTPSSYGLCVMCDSPDTKLALKDVLVSRVCNSCGTSFAGQIETEINLALRPTLTQEEVGMVDDLIVRSGILLAPVNNVQRAKYADLRAKLLKMK